MARNEPDGAARRVAHVRRDHQRAEEHPAQHHQPRPDQHRERAHQRYVEWWRTEGAERFAGRDAV